MRHAPRAREARGLERGREAGVPVSRVNTDKTPRRMITPHVIIEPTNYVYSQYK